MSPEPSDDSSEQSSTTSISGGVDLDAEHDVTIGGDVVGRDKFVQTIINELPAHGVISLHQLPAPPRDFVGRENELAELLACVENQGVTILGLQGTGGVGKTALALMLATRLSDRYPDAQFYLDLKGGSKHPLSTASIMAYIIRAYYPTAKLPENEAELSGMYQSVLHDQRTLLLLDNAADKWQVEPLLPPSSCILLVTSRQHFTLPGWQAKNLDTLLAKDARDLLLRIAPRLAGHADQIAELCGYFPLALRIAGDMAVDLAPEACVKRLTSANRRWKFLEPVKASLEVSYDLLDGDSQKRWCRLSVFQNEFTGAEAGAVWNLPSDLTDDQLASLRKRSLLEYNEQTGRYFHHDLVRNYAEAALPPDMWEHERGEIEQNIITALLETVALRNERALCFATRLCAPGWSIHGVRSAVLAALWDMVNSADRPARRLAALQLLNLRWWLDHAHDVDREQLMLFLEIVAPIADVSLQRRWLIECISGRLSFDLDIDTRYRVQLLIHRAALRAQLYQFGDAAELTSAERKQLKNGAKQDYASAEKLILSYLGSPRALPDDYRQLARVRMGKGNLAIFEAEAVKRAARRKLHRTAVNKYLAALRAARTYGEDLALIVKILQEVCVAYALLHQWVAAEKQFSAARSLLVVESIKALDERERAALVFLVHNAGAEMHAAHAQARRIPAAAKTDYEIAFQLTREAIFQLEQVVGDSQYLAIAYFSLGEYLKAMHDLPIPSGPTVLDEVRHCWQQARAISQRQKLWFMECLADKSLQSLE